MIETSQDYPLVALFGCMALVYISLYFIWSGAF
jgi:hypothetical protein